MVLFQVVLLSVVLASLLTDFGMTYGSVLFVAQAPDLHISVHKASTTASGGMFLQGPAGLLAVPLVQRYGRLPVLFWSQFITAFMVLGAALSPNYACFTAMRALQGWFNTAPQVVGLSVVHDLFFFHERTKRVNIWVYCLLGGPFLGPFLAAWFILGVSWRADYGILAGFHCFAALLIVLFGDETLYQRNSDEPAYKREKGLLGRIKLLTGITGAKMTGRPEIMTVLKDIIKIQFKPQIFFLSKSFRPPHTHHTHLTKKTKSCNLRHGPRSLDNRHQPNPPPIHHRTPLLLLRPRLSGRLGFPHARRLHRRRLGKLLQRLLGKSLHPHTQRTLDPRDQTLGYLPPHHHRLHGTRSVWRSVAKRSPLDQYRVCLVLHRVRHGCCHDGRIRIHARLFPQSCQYRGFDNQHVAHDGGILRRLLPVQMDCYVWICCHFWLSGYDSRCGLLWRRARHAGLWWEMETEAPATKS